MIIRIFRNKIHSKRGFSLSELLIVLLIMSIISAAIAIGISSAASAYKDIKASTESSILCGTLTTELTETLRYATNISAGSGNNAVFTNRRYGQNVSVGTVDGRIFVGNSPVLSESAYTELFADANVTYGGRVFTLTITVFDVDGETILTTQELSITPLQS